MYGQIEYRNKEILSTSSHIQNGLQMSMLGKISTLAKLYARQGCPDSPIVFKPTRRPYRLARQLHLHLLHLSHLLQLLWIQKGWVTLMCLDVDTKQSPVHICASASQQNGLDGISSHTLPTSVFVRGNGRSYDSPPPPYPAPLVSHLQGVGPWPSSGCKI